MSAPEPTDALAAAWDHHRAGRAALAEPLYRQVLAANPHQADALHLLGAICLQSGRAAEAVELIGRAVALVPGNPDFYSHLGAAYGSLERHDEAIATLRRAVHLAPQSAAAHYNLGTALRNAGRLEDAVASFRHSVAADPTAAEAHYNLANTLSELGRPAEAEAAYRAALQARPGYVKALINLANVLRDREQLNEAIEVLEQAIAADPNYAKGYYNLGTALRDAGNFEPAIAQLRRAIELAPDMAEAHNGLGTAVQALARYDEALACYETALAIDPDQAEAHFSRATYRLRAGEFERGFEEYEWRWKGKGFRERQFDVPRWNGAALDGKTILLHAEQGLGDTLQFVRYVPSVKARGGTVILECPAALKPLLSRCPGFDQLVVPGEGIPRFDCECPLMSLPWVLRQSPDAGAVEPYLFADPALVDHWREALSEFTALRVGLCWQGNPKHLFDLQRSIALARLAPLAGVRGVRLLSLQKGVGSEQVAGCGFDVVDLGPRLDEEQGPFMDTAAVMKNLDLVISTDTSLAHLAGGLGVRVWLALSLHCDWRWQFDRSDTPWYPTMRLFRQRRLDDWSDVAEQMAAELQSLAVATR